MSTLAIFDIDYLIDLIHQFLVVSWKYGLIIRSFLTLKWPYAREVVTTANAFFASSNVYHVLSAKPPVYWFSQMIQCLLGGFSGGGITSIFIGRPSGIFSNDFVVFISGISWFVVFYLGGHAFLKKTIPHTIMLLLVGLFRTNSITSMVTVANSVIAVGPYYPYVPISGPILAGTAVGCMGLFIPFTKGLDAIAKHMPWNIQGAFLSSVFFHFMVFDKKGPIGQGFRLLFGNLSQDDCFMCIALMHITHLQLHYWFHQHANLFTPFHKFLYFIFQVEGPKGEQKHSTDGSVGWPIHIRKNLNVLITLFRVFIIGFVILLHISMTSIPVSLKAVQFPTSLTSTPLPIDNIVTKSISNIEYNLLLDHALHINDSIGSCQSFASIRSCQPYILRFEHIDCYETPAQNPVLCANPHENIQENNQEKSKEIFHGSYYRLAIYSSTLHKYYGELTLTNTIPTSVIELVPANIFTLPQDINDSPLVIVSKSGQIALVQVTNRPSPSNLSLSYYQIATMSPDSNTTSHCSSYSSDKNTNKVHSLAKNLDRIEVRDGRIIGFCSDKREEL